MGQNLYTLAQLLHSKDQPRKAEEAYRRALLIFEKNYGFGLTIGITINALAGLRGEQGDWAEAAQLYMRAKPIMTGAPDRPTGDQHSLVKVALTQHALNLRAAARAVHRAGSSNAAAREAGFEFAQWALQTGAADALAQMSVRFAKGGGPLAQIVRDRQDLISRRQGEDKRLLAAVGAADAKATEAIRAAISGLDARLDAIDIRIAADFKDFAALSIPKPLATAEVQSFLRDNEAFLLFLDVPQLGRLPEESLVWAITKTDARWARIDLGTAALSDRIAALRCGLDHTLWQSADSAERCRKMLNASPRDETVKGADKDRRVQVLPFDLERAHALYKALLGPVEDMIKGKHLLVVPSGPLTSLPFHVLVTETPSPRASPTSPHTTSKRGEGGGEGQQQTLAPVAAPHPSPLPASGERESGRRALGTLTKYRNAAWLGTRQPITVLPSVASLKALRQFAKASRASKAYLGVGNPLLDGPQDDLRWGAHYKKQADAARAKQQCPRILPQRIAQAAARPLAGFAELFRGALADIEEVRRWTPLPETADELCEVGRRLGVPESEILLGTRATETALKDLSEKERLTDYAILHFATHGALTGQVQGNAEPGLILTPPAKGASDATALERDDGFLTASEIATLKLDADWVILSACNTAGASGETAEPMSGMARAFFYAGARALLVSHWEVGSDAAVKLTTKAFAELKSSPAIGRAEAFRRSMRDLIARGGLAEAHPSMWAPFVVVGEGG